MSDSTRRKPILATALAILLGLGLQSLTSSGSADEPGDTASAAAEIAAAKNKPAESPQTAASQVDELIAAAIAGSNNRAVESSTPSTGSVPAPSAATISTPRIDDATFLRRVYLDFVGAPPTPAQIQAFLESDRPDKRQLLVDWLLEDPRFGGNWANYWRDVILARRTDNRQLLQVSNSLTRYLRRSFNRSTGWDQIARDFITATGNIREQGNTGLIYLQQGKSSESASEVSRVFLGIQISCAQCHDHPSDRWTREQFHELAAFFPRIRVRRQFKGKQRTFNVVAQDRGPRRPKLNKQGKKREPIEHFMPDLEDPAAEGTRMSPKFFVNGKTLPLGTPDAERRSQLAEWIVDPANPWFARAYVNRMWAELVGWGFYEPVDDLGPGRQADALPALDYLCREFVNSGHDTKWLFRTIAATEAYHRGSRSRDPSGAKQLLAGTAQPLRGDALFDSLVVALNLPAAQVVERVPPLAPIGKSSDDDEGNMDAMEMEMEDTKPRKRQGPRKLFQAAFAYDPSLPRADVKASIPQALAMMNAPQIHNQINSRRRRSLIRKITDEHEDDAEVVEQLYLHCLAREPSPAELETCLRYLRNLDNRGEALEDIQWSLINSAEFRHRK